MPVIPSGRPRNGRRPGDVSYLSLALPDVARGERFYAGLLGWTFPVGQPGRPQGDDVTPEVQQGDGVTPEVGMWDGARPGRAATRGAVPGFRVEDIGVSVVRVRDLGGTATDAVERPYGLEAECSDNQGLPLFLHQLPDEPADDGTDLTNGRQHGDVAYLTFEVADLGLAEAFYGPLLGWSFSAGSVDEGRQITGVTPMAGLWAGGTPGLIPAYRVDDIGVAVARTAELGGVAGPIDERPYGLAADFCRDDQGIRFHLVELG